MAAGRADPIIQQVKKIRKLVTVNKYAIILSDNSNVMQRYLNKQIG